MRPANSQLRVSHRLPPQSPADDCPALATVLSSAADANPPRNSVHCGAKALIKGVERSRRARCPGCFAGRSLNTYQNDLRDMLTTGPEDPTKSVLSRS